MLRVKFTDIESYIEEISACNKGIVEGLVRSEVVVSADGAAQHYEFRSSFVYIDQLCHIEFDCGVEPRPRREEGLGGREMSESVMGRVVAHVKSVGLNSRRGYLA